MSKDYPQDIKDLYALLDTLRLDVMYINSAHADGRVAVFSRKHEFLGYEAVAWDNFNFDANTMNDLSGIGTIIRRNVPNAIVCWRELNPEFREELKRTLQSNLEDSRDLFMKFHEMYIL